ncbi:MAG: type II toxin-antitoxin system VapC family toxin [Promethearchaeota archaeon]
MKKYTIDAVAFLLYLAGTLPMEADNIFKLAENNEILLLLPSIVLGEVLYTIYKGREIFGKKIPVEKIDLIFQILQTTPSIQLAYLDLEAWQIFHGLSFPELYDRMIVALSRKNKVEAIITNDPSITESEPVIWN